LQTLQGYIIRILHHFATKLWNITYFVMLFQAMMTFLSRLVEFKILVNWGMVHQKCPLFFQSPSGKNVRLVTNSNFESRAFSLACGTL
jgi:hypothetical protein